MAKKIVSLQHPIVKHLVKLRISSRYRNENRTVIVMGKKMISEICPHHETKKLLITKETTPLPGVKSQDIYLVTEAILKKISGVRSPAEILAEVTMPIRSSLQECRYLVAFDKIRDPGNLGTLLRTALALEWEGAYILDNSCDPYNDKAVRAAKGATFRLPLQRGGWEELKKLAKDNQLIPIAADCDGQKIQNLPIQDRVLLVLSSEAHGLSAEGEKFCQKVTIPTSDTMKSLNVSVAGGILMYLMREL